MIARPELKQLSPTERAHLIFRSAQIEANDGLWRSAMGSADDRGDSARSGAEPIFGLRALIGAMLERQSSASPEVRMTPETRPVGDSGTLSLGANARSSEAIERAARRTGLPPSALATIVDAESAKDSEGVWNSRSRNPRSSAAGLGQFLSSTWVGEAERRGTWLNDTARENGWLDGRGRVLASAKADLLALRYQPDASIEAVADYARHNLDRLRRAGVEVGEDAQSVARTAYLAHHLGPGDALRFLRGGLGSERAAVLLKAQVGATQADRRIADAGEAAAAHRRWLTGYIDRRIRPDRFEA